jgi:glycerol kinase
MCFQVKNVLDSMHKDAGEEGEVKNEKGEFLLMVDGGATVNNLSMQIRVWALCVSFVINFPF